MHRRGIGKDTRPSFGADPASNRELLRALVSDRSRAVTLPAGVIPLSAGIDIPAGTTLQGQVDGAGRPATVLTVLADGPDPLLNVLGSDVRISDLRLELPLSDPGPHDGHRHTAITIGDYLYGGPPYPVRNITLVNVAVHRSAPCAATSVCVIGDVADVAIDQLHVWGGGTGLGVHWGAQGESVSSVRPPTVHPHRIRVDDLHVRYAFEGWYLSSVHDVAIRNSSAEHVEIGFRLLPGDNGARFADPRDSAVGSAILVQNCSIAWHGPLYGVRVAGWGRSEVDQAVTRLAYRDVVVRSCRLHALALVGDEHPDQPRCSIVLEEALGVDWEDLDISGVHVAKTRQGVGPTG